MNSKRKLIFGMVVLTMGILFLVIGLLEYIRATGIDALLYPSVKVLDFVIVFGIFSMAWGISWLVTGMAFIIWGLIDFSFRSRKPMVVGIILLVLSSLFSGGVLLAGLL